MQFQITWIYGPLICGLSSNGTQSALNHQSVERDTTNIILKKRPFEVRYFQVDTPWCSLMWTLALICWSDEITLVNIQFINSESKTAKHLIFLKFLNVSFGESPKYFPFEEENSSFRRPGCFWEAGDASANQVFLTSGHSASFSGLTSSSIVSLVKLNNYYCDFKIYIYF